MTYETSLLILGLGKMMVKSSVVLMLNLGLNGHIGIQYGAVVNFYICIVYNMSVDLSWNVVMINSVVSWYK